MTQKTYVAQWDYRSGFGSFRKGEELILDDSQVDLFNRDSPGVLAEKGTSRALSGPPSHRMVTNSENRTEINATVSALELAQKHGIDLARVTGSGQDGRIVKADVSAIVDG